MTPDERRREARAWLLGAVLFLFLVWAAVVSIGWAIVEYVRG